MTKKVFIPEPNFWMPLEYNISEVIDNFIETKTLNEDHVAVKNSGGEAGTTSAKIYGVTLSRNCDRDGTDMINWALEGSVVKVLVDKETFNIKVEDGLELDEAPYVDKDTGRMYKEDGTNRIKATNLVCTIPNSVEPTLRVVNS